MAKLVLLVVLLTVAGRSCSAISVPNYHQAASEIEDLLSPASSERKQEQFLKTKSKNVSGKSDEGGFYKSYGSDADGEKGYLKKSFDKAGRGYKNFDTFHKKFDDQYGFAEQESFDEPKQQQHHASKSKASQKRAKDHEGAGTDIETYFVDEGDGDAEGYAGDYSSGEASSYAGGSSGSGETYYTGSSGGGGEGDGGGGSYEFFSGEADF